MEITLKPVAFVSNSRTTTEDDNWGGIISEIMLATDIPDEVFKGISAFSHLEIIYYFHKVEAADIRYSGHPRGNPAYPEVGIFVQRKKDRPNRLGICMVELLEHSGRKLKVRYLDAIDGTPVLDIKPVVREFSLPAGICQPDWITDLMKRYWQ